MADVTVSELAEKVGTSVERLLKQIKEAGLSEKIATSLVNDDEKRTLLTFLKNNHGDSAPAPKKMTLQRKTKSTIKGPGRKSVSVETRKKRTYVKRDAEAEVAEKTEEKTQETTDVVQTAPVDTVESKPEVVVAATESVVEPKAVAEVEVSATSETEATGVQSEPKQEVKAEPEVKTEPEMKTEDVVPVAEAPATDKPKADKKSEAKPSETQPSEAKPSQRKPSAPKAGKAKAPEAKAKPAASKGKPNTKGKPASKAKGTPAPKAPAEKAPQPIPAPTPKKFSFTDDAEERRIAAMKARKEEEARQAEELKRKKAELEEKKRQDAEQKTATTQKKPAAPAAKPAAEKAPAHQFRRPAPTAVKEDEDEGIKTKKPSKSRVKGAGPKKANIKTLLNYVDDDFDEESGRRQRRRAASSKSNQHGFKKPTGKIVHEVELGENVVVSELAQRMSVKAAELVKRLMKMGVMATVNQTLDRDTAQLIIEEMGHKVKLVSDNQLEDDVAVAAAEEGESVSRAAVVTVMGHVDHGKTSLLDYIRKAKVASGEAGGITQHIGAYRVKTNHGDITFLDTPGHAAFTAMRARGAQCTDVVILVVAADDGMMPQTREAVEHARAAGVPIVVAVNKIDKDTADPDRVRNDLSTVEVIPEEWGGDTQFVNVSAHTGEGIDELLEAVALQAELLELSAQTKVPARGVVVESRMEKGRGVVSTVLVQHGELARGNILLAGQSFGRVRAMTNEFGQQVKHAGPSTPVEILGLDTAPNAGDDFLVVSDERKAREVAENRAEREREERQRRQQAAKLENMFANFGGSGEEQKILPVVLKADVRGSLEAISAALMDIGNEEVQVNIVSSGIGGITDNDINLAVTSGAIVLGFNVRAAASTRSLAEEESVEIRYYSVIYQLLDEVKSALGGMLAPERVEEIVGIADVREVFRSPKFGQVAGCMVTEGTVYRSKPIRVLRDNVVIFEGELESLRRFKDDVNDVRNGMECGIGVKDYDVKVGDQIEVYDVKEVAREL